MNNINWIKHSERPLAIYDDNGNGGNSSWETTKDGDKYSDFMVAVATIIDGKAGWWIGRCAIEDETGLVEVMDNYTESCGWEISDITFWCPIDLDELNKLEK